MSTSITIESPRLPIPLPSKPKPSIQHGFSEPGVSLEMYDMPERSAVPGNSVNKTQTLESRPPLTLELVNSSSPGRMVDQMQTLWEPYKNRFRVLAACLTVFANGMNDSANGALIGSIEKYSGTSLLFDFTDRFPGITTLIMELLQLSFSAMLLALLPRRFSSAYCLKGLGEPRL
jgi:hypothetical protein